MKIYRAQTPQNLALAKILHKFRRASTPQERLFTNEGGVGRGEDRGLEMLHWNQTVKKLSGMFLNLTFRSKYQNFIMSRK